jgi:hypothetical protein
MILIINYKYYYFLVYIWSKLKVLDFSGSEKDIYFGTEGVCFFLEKSTGDFP